jgi:hypothetical protein
VLVMGRINGQAVVINTHKYDFEIEDPSYAIDCENNFDCNHLMARPCFETKCGSAQDGNICLGRTITKIDNKRSSAYKENLKTDAGLTLDNVDYKCFS